MEEKKKNKLYKKWWFWVCIVIIIIILSFTAILIKSYDYVNSGISGIALQMQDVNEDITVYSSSGGSTLILQIDDEEITSEELQSTKAIIKENLDTELANYSKLIIYGNVKGNIISISEYSLPDFEQLSYTSYIDFEEYENMFNTLYDAGTNLLDILD